MSSERQTEANRKNAQLSTGPRTAEGKAQVASNALKHGLTGKQITLPNENPEDFDAFRVGLLDELRPDGELEGALAQKIVTDLWRLRRVPALEAAINRRGYKERIIDELETERRNLSDGLVEVVLGDRQAHADVVAKLKKTRSELDDPSMAVTIALQSYSKVLANLDRHEAALVRSLFRTRDELKRLQAIRAAERVATPAVVDVDVNITPEGAANPEAVSARVEPDATPIEDKKVHISFFITKSQRAQLLERGYSGDDIAKMKPAEAHKILGLV
jgi:hypothetical protein